MHACESHMGVVCVYVFPYSSHKLSMPAYELISNATNVVKALCAKTRDKQLPIKVLT